MARFTYIVEGSGQFPFDMLRYDQAFPTSENDSYLLTETGQRRISLSSDFLLCAESSSKLRWSSFNWTVKPLYG